MAGQLGNPIGTHLEHGYTDCNDIEVNGYYPFIVVPDNSPTGNTGGLLMLGSTIIKTQIYITDTGAYFYYRRRWYNNDWSDWKRVDNFGYNTLAELANGVATQINIKPIKSSTYVSISPNTPVEIETSLASSSYGSGYRNCLLALYSPTHNDSGLYLLTPQVAVKDIIANPNISITKQGSVISITNNTSTDSNWYYSLLHF